MANIAISESRWAQFSQSLREALGGSVKRLTVENGVMTITKNDGTTSTVTVGANVPAATDSLAGTMKLYAEPGTNNDGTMTQAAIKAGIDNVQNALFTHVEQAEAKLSGVYKFKGSVAYYANLPTTGNEAGDVYNIRNANKSAGILAGDNVAWAEAKSHIAEGYERATGTYDPTVTYYTNNTTGTEIDTAETVTEYVQATGNYVGGTTYYTDSTGKITVDTSTFEDGVTDVSSYYIANTHDKFQEGITDMTDYFVHYSRTVIDQEEGWDKLAGNFVLPLADSVTAGIMKLAQEKGTDAASTMSQAAITAAINTVADAAWTTDKIWVE